MLNILVDNLFMFRGRVFQQTKDIPMGTNCAPLLNELFFYTMENTSYKVF